ncbi:MAG: hypothetical protein GY866_09905 [Proteobacteria bacterium]|nr:hypothetical protein [Pseudomonadota bacterium]
MSVTADDREALKIAIDFEKKGCDFYTDLKNKADTLQEKEFFKQLAAIEYEHFLSLSDTLLLFEYPVHWFAEREKPHFEG